MDKLTSDLQGVAVYMDDILVSGATASEHLQNLRSLLKRLEEKRSSLPPGGMFLCSVIHGVPWTYPLTAENIKVKKGGCS